MIVDYHMHLRDERGDIAFTADAIEPFVERAVERGVDEIGFTEHVYYFRQTHDIWDVAYQLERCVFDIEAYCGAVVEAKRRGLPVKLGLEVDYVGSRQSHLSEILEPYPWDFLLGSVHWLESEAVDQDPGVWAGSSVDDVWRRYFDAVAELASSGAIDVLAHLDLAKIFDRRPSLERRAELYEAVADAIAGAGVCIEISTAGLRKPVGELYPDAELLSACVRRGVGLTLASDAHDPQLVGEDFDLALALAGEARCETVVVFEGREGREEPLG
ncbi:MAG TPA: histidinol-phosphatase [Gaiellaceae bacterium]|nr:histidinol-phosphatase [Gaiellaceae bacterium]